MSKAQERRDKKFQRLPVMQDIPIEQAAQIIGVSKGVFLRDYLHSGHFPLPDYVVRIYNGVRVIAIRRER